MLACPGCCTKAHESTLWQGHQQTLPSKFILELDLEDTMLVENAQPMAVVEVGLVESYKPFAEIWDRGIKWVTLHHQYWHHSSGLQS